jgi:hypothetical protein
LLLSQDYIEVFAGQSLTYTVWLKVIDSPNGSVRIGILWYNALLQFLGDTASHWLTITPTTYQQIGGAVRVPFNSAYCKVGMQTKDHTSGGTWIFDDAFVSVAENDQGQLPAIGTQYPGQVETGTYLQESLVATSVAIVSDNEVGYVSPQGLIELNVDSGVTAVLQARRAHPAGEIVGSALVTNLANGTITTPVSLKGVDGAPVWDGVYVLTALGVHASGTIVPITMRPGSTFAMVHVPTGVDFGAEAFSASLSTGSKGPGETVIATSPTIDVATEAGVIIPQAWANLTVAATSTVLLQVRQEDISGAVVGSGLFANPLSTSVAIRVDATGIDLAPVWDDVYVLTVQSVDATPTANAVTVDAGGGFRLVHRLTGADPAQLDVFDGTVDADTYTGDFTGGAVIATSDPTTVALQAGYFQAAGMIPLTVTAGSLTLVRVRQRDALGKIIGAVVISNQTGASLTVPIAIQGYDPEPRWGDVYVVTVVSANEDLAPIALDVESGGTFAMLHTRLT